MEPTELEGILAASERALEEERGLAEAGFWRAVGAAKRDPRLAEAYGERFANIDRAAFERWAWFTTSAGAGTAVMAAGTVLGLLLVLWAYYVETPWDGLLLLAGTAATLVTTHGLAHLAVGAALGMRFTHWFVGSPTRPQPGVKVDYASYLQTPARHRAWMHASGAIATKLIPFLALGPAFVIPVPWWTTALLVLIGVVQIGTDVVFSTKNSDWKKYAREMRHARAGQGR